MLTIETVEEYRVVKDNDLKAVFDSRDEAEAYVRGYEEAAQAVFDREQASLESETDAAPEESLSYAEPDEVFEDTEPLDNGVIEAL
jgi:dsDNA-binding SOS-regulon protein